MKTKRAKKKPSPSVVTAHYRIVGNEVQLLTRKEGWQTVARCTSQEAAAKALGKRMSSPRQRLEDAKR